MASSTRPPSSSPAVVPSRSRRELLVTAFLKYLFEQSEAALSLGPNDDMDQLLEHPLVGSFLDRLSSRLGDRSQADGSGGQRGRMEGLVDKVETDRRIEQQPPKSSTSRTEDPLMDTKRASSSSFTAPSRSVPSSSNPRVSTSRSALSRKTFPASSTSTSTAAAVTSSGQIVDRIKLEYQDEFREVLMDVRKAEENKEKEEKAKRDKEKMVLNHQMALWKVFKVEPTQEIESPEPTSNPKVPETLLRIPDSFPMNTTSTTMIQSGNVPKNFDNLSVNSDNIPDNSKNLTETSTTVIRPTTATFWSSILAIPPFLQSRSLISNFCQDIFTQVKATVTNALMQVGEIQQPEMDEDSNSEDNRGQMSNKEDESACAVDVTIPSSSLSSSSSSTSRASSQVGEYKKWTVLEDGSAIINGWRHQGDSQLFTFPGLQCVGNCAAAVVQSHHKGLADWERALIFDRILIQGDRLYGESWQLNGRDPDGPGHIDVNQLKRNCVLFQIETVLERFDNPPINGMRDDQSSLLLHLTFLFSNCNNAIVIAGGRARAVIQQDGLFYLFDPHSVNEFGEAVPNGRASIFAFKSVDQLTVKLFKILNHGHTRSSSGSGKKDQLKATDQYTIDPIWVKFPKHPKLNDTEHKKSNLVEKKYELHTRIYYEQDGREADGNLINPRADPEHCSEDDPIREHERSLPERNANLVSKRRSKVDSSAVKDGLDRSVDTPNLLSPITTINSNCGTVRKRKLDDDKYKNFFHKVASQKNDTRKKKMNPTDEEEDDKDDVKPVIRMGMVCNCPNHSRHRKLCGSSTEDLDKTKLDCVMNDPEAIHDDDEEDSEKDEMMETNDDEEEYEMEDKVDDDDDDRDDSDYVPDTDELEDEEEEGEDHDDYADEEEEEEDEDFAPPKKRPLKASRPSHSTNRNKNGRPKKGSKQVITLGLECAKSDCGQVFKGFKQYRHHMKTAHSILQYKCAVNGCGQYFSSTHRLNEHIELCHTTPECWICPNCDKSLAGYRGLSDHLKRMHPEYRRRFQCAFPLCKFVGSSEQVVYTHRAATHNPSIKCTKSGCQFETSNKKNFQSHRQSHLGIKPYQCKWPNCHYASTYRKTAVIHIVGHIERARKQKKICGEMARSDSTEAPSEDPLDFLEVDIAQLNM